MVPARFYASVQCIGVLLQMILMQLLAFVGIRVGDLLRQTWRNFKHHLVLSYLPEEYIRQTYVPSNLGTSSASRQVPARSCLESINQFVYKPLTNPQTTFRLFLLDETPLQLSGVSVLSGCLLHSPLTNPPEYISLPYSSGSGLENQPIIIDGMRFSITKALATTLENIRVVRTGVLALLIDQICIDQTNDVEKGHQVKQMGLIYQRARLNLAWLGEATSQSARAFDMVRIMTRAMPENRSFEGLGRWNSSYQLIDESTFSPDDWTAFEATFEHRKLWLRVWIIQELVLAKVIELQCGHRVLQWEAVDFFLSRSNLDIEPRRHLLILKLTGAPLPDLQGVAIVKRYRDLRKTRGTLKIDLTKLLVDF